MELNKISYKPTDNKSWANNNLYKILWYNKFDKKMLNDISKFTRMLKRVYGNKGYKRSIYF